MAASIKPLRLVQCATGAVGLQSLRGIIEREGFELVGLRVYSPEKAGMDAGDIAGMDPVGVAATDDIEAALRLDPDCVVYAALGDTADVGPALDEICAFLEAGANVVSSAVGVPITLDENISQRLAEACIRGGSSFVAAGCNPGFLLDVWPLCMSRLMRRLDSFELREMDDMSDYTSVAILNFMAFGAPLDAPNSWTAAGRVEDTTVYRYFVPSIRFVERATGLHAEEFRVETEFATAEERIEMKVKTIEPGTISAVSSKLIGTTDGREVACFHAMYTSNGEIPEDWPMHEGKSRWYLRLDGDPQIETTLRLTDVGGHRADIVATAAHLLNAIPSLCAASPGLKSLLDLPPFGGFAAPTEAVTC